jgi:hypothetical protein
MNHYDDLQRFKDKTRNQALDFKDFSGQNQVSEQGSWAILNQLLPATATNALAAGGHVSLPVPQPVTPEAFALTEAAFVPDRVVIETVSHDGPSILNDVAEQLAATPDTVSAAPAPAPAPAPESVRAVMPAPAEVNFSRLFAPATNTPKPTAEKNQPLNSLLERIATCR